ncbi:hypothetical protein [Halorussus halophilus]|uniref:hypothetical protein n=1 Tax=Halorussus halophilus TaxID=2650975 RepID=UPI0013010B4F|nr:hypothetical protein [Halorussus halophilus]
MPSERILDALQLFTRLVGVVIAAGGVLLSTSAPIFGVPLVVVGLLFVLRPAIASELLDIVASAA